MYSGHGGDFAHLPPFQIRPPPLPRRSALPDRPRRHDHPRRAELLGHAPRDRRPDGSEQLRSLRSEQRLPGSPRQAQRLGRPRSLSLTPSERIPRNDRTGRHCLLPSVHHPLRAELPGRHSMGRRVGRSPRGVRRLSLRDVRDHRGNGA